ncbi:MAG: methyltransferase domain-containing protein [Clostridia bacterium]
MSAYDKFSKIYDKLMYDCDYDKWSQYLVATIKDGKDGVLNGADLACGSGNVTIRLKAAGLNVFGVDTSEEMLRIAAEKTRSHGQKINYICVDAVKFEAPRKLDFVTMCLDGVNYVEKQKIKPLFQNVFDNLKENGVFLFDISSAYKLLEYIGENVFYDDGDDVTYLWTNKLDEKRQFVDYEIAFFVLDGEIYRRFDESHRLFAHDKDELLEILKQVGFSDVKVAGSEFESVKGKFDMRYNFIARK